MSTARFPRRPDVFARGNPEGGVALDRTITGLVHKYVAPPADGTSEARTLCSNGAFHVWFAKRNSSVTCPECLKRLP